MRVLVCGSRDWDDETVIFNILSMLWQNNAKGFVLIEGGARGADAAAARWADMYGRMPEATHLQFPADWEKHGKAAGPIRNKRMLGEGLPDVVWAFVNKNLEDSRGTNDMCQRAWKAGIPVYVVYARV